MPNELEQIESTESSAEVISLDAIEKPADLNVPDEYFRESLRDDPEYAELLRSQQASKGVKPEKKEVDTDKGVDADSLSTEEKEVNTDTDKQATEEPGTEDKNTSTETGAEEVFADNVIEGLKGEDFGKLSDEGKLALSSFLEKTESSQKELAKVQSKLSQFENDPIIKSRMAMLQSGKDAYDVGGLNQTEKAGIVNHLQSKYGIDSEDANSIIKDIEDGLDTVAKQRATDIANNTLLQSEAVRKNKEVIENGRKMFLGLSVFNKSLEIKEKDISKFYVGVNADGSPIYNNRHPEIDNFKNGVEKIMKHCASVGIGYEHAIKMGPKQVYALAAAALDLPVSMNNQQQLQAIAKDVKMQALSRWKKAGSGTLSVESKTSQAERNSAKQNHVDGGYDVVKLANDGDYYEKCLNQKPLDLGHKQKIDALVEKGRSIERAKSSKKR
jgi:hypothetical protein